MKINVFASRTHYWDHISPIFQRLPEEMRGTVTILDGPKNRRVMVQSGSLVIVGSTSDVKALRLGKNETIFVEHGAGQTYNGVDGYSGSTGMEGVKLFLCPSNTVADRWEEKYPSTPSVVVGCPRLDLLRAKRASRPKAEPIVAVAWHWDAKHLCPEARSAHLHYRKQMPEFIRAMRGRGIRIVGHGHPREWSKFEQEWKTLGVEPWRDSWGMLARIDALVVDNSSIAYEAASLDIPVLSLNAPWYRRNVSHGLRFWDSVPGLQCDEPEDLADAVMATLADPAGARNLRAVAATAAYAFNDDKASERAAQAIISRFG